MKYKVGDKVRIREDLEIGKAYNDLEFEKYMQQYKGRTTVITEIWCYCYSLSEDNGEYGWTDEMLEPVEKGEKNDMNIEKLNEEYKAKMDALMEEYKDKVKEATKKEEPFIEIGQDYYFIDSTVNVCISTWDNCRIDQQRLLCGNCYPFTEENEEQVKKEVNLIAERKKLQNQMEMFARLNNDKINWGDINLPKWFLCNWQNNIEIGSLCVRYPNIIYFSSEEIAEKALKKFGTRLRELYIDAENNSKDSEQ